MPAKPRRVARKKSGPPVKETPAEINPADLIAPYYQREPSSARTLRWVGTLSCAALIILLWGWALTLRVSSISWQATDENKFVSETKQSWDGAFAAEQAKQPPLASVRSAISAIIAKTVATAPAANASSTATTTEISATSTNATTTAKKTDRQPSPKSY